MKIGILGTGRMTTVLGARLVGAGHEVVVGSRQPARARLLSDRLGAAGGTDYRHAAQAADIVILAIHDSNALEIAGSVADLLEGTVLIDINNPIDPPAYESRYAGTPSLAERIAEIAPAARVVKAFNTVYAEWLAEGAEARFGPVQVFLASDDEFAKSAVAALVEQIGSEPIDVGPLRASRQLESLAGFGVALVERGYAPFVGFRLLAGS